MTLLAAGGVSLAITLLEDASAVDESAVPVVLFVVAVPEAAQSVEESDWKTDWTIDGISAAVRLLISSVEVRWHGCLSWLAKTCQWLSLFT